MKVKTLSALAGLGGALILSSSANAAYTGLSIVLHTTVDPSGIQGLTDVYRVYANFNNAGDRMTTVFGNAGSPLTINTNGATVYNPGNGGNVPLDSTALAYADNAEWDSYATIGLAAGYVGAPGANLTLSPGFPLFLTSAGIIANTNIAWTTAGPQPQGAPDGSGRVLIMQISVNAGHAAPSGSIGLTYTPAGGTSTNAINQTFAIPAPGALALLGLAGLVGARRRRA